MTDPSSQPHSEQDALFASYIGPRWESYYRGASEKLQAGGFATMTFNPAAALAPLWMAWRGMWIYQLGGILMYWFLALLATAALDNAEFESVGVPWAGMVLAYVAMGLLEGLAGDRLLLGKARLAVTRARARHADPDATLAAMKRYGGTSFAAPALVTLLAVMIVVMLPVLVERDQRELAYLAATKADLRSLEHYQEGFYQAHQRYNAAPFDSFRAPGDSLIPAVLRSTYVSITMGPLAADGWSATARHELVPGYACAIYVGRARPPLPDMAEGEPKCVNQEDRR